MSSVVDLKRKLLTVATVLSPPYVFLELKNGTWFLSGGIEVRLLNSLSQHFNFTYKVVNCNSDWGIRQPNQTWTGLIGKIVSKEADLAFAGLTVTAERSQYVYFTHPHIITSVSFITPPPKTEPKVTLVIEPFDELVWVSVILSMLLLVVIDWLITKKWNYIKKVDIKWAIVSVLLRQTLSCHLPNVFSLRIMICFWLLASLVLTASYSGCLYSLMAIPTKAKPINTLTELALAQRKGFIQITAIGGSAYYDSLKRSNFGVYKDIGEFIQPVKNKREGLEIVMNSTKPHSYISTRDHLSYGLLKYGSKSFHLPPPTEESTVFLDVMAIAMQKGFEYKNKFNQVISDIKKGGFFDYWRLTENRRIFWKQRTNGNNSTNAVEEDNEDKSLHLDQLQSAFYLFAIGQSLTILFVLIEVISKISKSRLKQ